MDRMQVYIAAKRGGGVELYVEWECRLTNEMKG